MQTQPFIPRLDNGSDNTGFRDLRRFLITGSDSPIMHSGPSVALFADNIPPCVESCISSDGLGVLRLLRDAGSECNQDAKLFAYAAAFSIGDELTRKEAREQFPALVITAPQLFRFLSYARGMRGWGRGLRRAVAEWYTSKQPRTLAYQLTTYPAGHGFTHRDVLRLAHVKPDSGEMSDIFSYMLGNLAALDTTVNRATPGLAYLKAAQRLENPHITISELEQLMNGHLFAPSVLEARLPNTQDIKRYLLRKTLKVSDIIARAGELTALGVMRPGGNMETELVAALDTEAKVHSLGLAPMSLVFAYYRYVTGTNEQGNTWTPSPAVANAIQVAFRHAVSQLTKGLPQKAVLVCAVAPPGSAPGNLAGTPGLSVRSMHAILSVVTRRALNASVCVKLDGTVVQPITCEPTTPFKEVLDQIAPATAGTGSVKALIEYAGTLKGGADCIIVASGGGENCDMTGVTDALRAYREKFNRPTRLLGLNYVPGALVPLDTDDPGQFALDGLGEKWLNHVFQLSLEDL